MLTLLLEPFFLSMRCVTLMHEYVQGLLHGFRNTLLAEKQVSVSSLNGGLSGRSVCVCALFIVIHRRSLALYQFLSLVEFLYRKGMQSADDLH